jgi:phage terminase large subunit-like protein
VNGGTPDFQRVVVAVDPSGADGENPDHDAIGNIVAALGTDGHAYVLEDLTANVPPAVWGNIATTAFDRHMADAIIGESNYGGAMVKHVIQTARPNTPYQEVHASRGKVIRAEPIAALYETGKVHHVGYFPDLEDELCAFSTAGYMGERSPNRADALVWALTALFPGMTKEKKEIKRNAPLRSNAGWQGM